MYAEEKEEEVKILERSVEVLEGTINVLENKVYGMEDEVKRQHLIRDSLEHEIQALTQRLSIVENLTGSSDGLIRCWDAKLGHEVYKITVGLGGIGSGAELCIWSLLALRNGTLVSGDSNGSVQFWDYESGTLLNARSYHKGDVNALAATPNHDQVFAADSDGQMDKTNLQRRIVELDDMIRRLFGTQNQPRIESKRGNSSDFSHSGKQKQLLRVDDELARYRRFDSKQNGHENEAKLR